MNVEQYSSELIQKGIALQAQDLYIQPEKDQYAISFRKGRDYLLEAHLTQAEGTQLLRRLKYLGGMDVGENRRSQLGALTYQLPDCEQRLRLSSVGNYRQQESLVVRFLHHFERSTEHYLLAQQPKIIAEHVKARGLYLFAGPVGSGKTTLMYRLAKASGKKVITIEDPVEIEEESFLQLQVNKKIEQGYDELIKLSLRHQPELLIIGEIRDQVTATAAVRAALTGHTVFATLHIRELAQAEMRLIELGASASVVAECLQGVIYQEIMQVEEQRGMLAGYRFKVANTWQVEQDFANSLQEVRGEGEWK